MKQIEDRDPILMKYSWARAFTFPLEGDKEALNEKMQIKVTTGHTDTKGEYILCNDHKSSSDYSIRSM
jgi:hypothetical protein